MPGLLKALGGQIPLISCVGYHIPGGFVVCGLGVVTLWVAPYFVGVLAGARGGGGVPHPDGHWVDSQTCWQSSSHSSWLV